MQKTLFVRHSVMRGPHPFRVMGRTLLLMLALSGAAWAQQIPVTGTVTSSGGALLRGVIVRVVGTDVNAVTNGSGRYSITAPSDGTLTFTLLG